MNCRNCGYSVKHSTDGYCINCGTKVRGGFLSKLFSSREKSENSVFENLKAGAKRCKYENWESPITVTARAIDANAQVEQQTAGAKSVTPKVRKEESVLYQILSLLFDPWWARSWDEEEDLLVSKTTPDEHDKNAAYLRSRGGNW